MLIELNKLRAANVCASKEETRYYLNGVLFEIVNGEGALVATDGHRLVKIPVKCKGADQSVIIPSSLINKIKPVRGVDQCNFLFSSTGAIEIEYDGTTFTDKAIDGTFPDYRRCIPDHESDAKTKKQAREKLNKAELEKEVIDIFEIGFNPRYLADFAKINDILGFKNAGVKMRMTDKITPVIITMGGATKNEYTGVLMPLRV